MQHLRLLKQKARIFVEASLRRHKVFESRTAWPKPFRDSVGASYTPAMPETFFELADPTHTLLYDHGWRRQCRVSHGCSGLPEVFVHLTKPALPPWELCGGWSEAAAAGSGSSSLDTPVLPALKVAKAVPWVSSASSVAPTSEVLSGVVAIIKSPCLHPGDLQLCYAVRQGEGCVPCGGASSRLLNPCRMALLFGLEQCLWSLTLALQVGPEDLPPDSPLRAPFEREPTTEDPDPPCFAFRDLVVFPSPPLGSYTESADGIWPPVDSRHPAVFRNQGPGLQYCFRDIPNMLSGGDLDGDRYWIIWEPSIVQPLLENWKRGLAAPPSSVHEPAINAHPEEPQGFVSTSGQLTGPVTCDDALSSGSRSSGSSRTGSETEVYSDTSDAAASSCTKATANGRQEEHRQTGGWQASIPATASLTRSQEKHEAASEESRREAYVKVEAQQAKKGNAAGNSLLGETESAEGNNTHKQRTDAPQDADIVLHRKGKREEDEPTRKRVGLLGTGPTERQDIEKLTRFLLRVQGLCQLGVISNTHLRLCHSPNAYYEENPLKAKGFNRLSLALADLAAAAVDAPKTGKKVVLKKRLRCVLMPHFLVRPEKRHADFAGFPGEIASRVIASRSLLGSLYDRVLPHALLATPSYLTPRALSGKPLMPRSKTDPLISCYTDGLASATKIQSVKTGEAFACGFLTRGFAANGGAVSLCCAGNSDPRLFAPLRVKVTWGGVQYKEEAQRLCAGDGRVHMLLADVELPASLLIGGPSPPDYAHRGAPGGTLTALRFSFPNCLVCAQRSSCSLAPARGPPGACCLRVPASAPGALQSRRVECILVHQEASVGDSIPYPLLYCSLSCSLGLPVGDAVAAVTQLTLGGTSLPCNASTLAAGVVSTTRPLLVRMQKCSSSGSLRSRLASLSSLAIFCQLQLLMGGWTSARPAGLAFIHCTTKAFFPYLYCAAVAVEYVEACSGEVLVSPAAFGAACVLPSPPLWGGDQHAVYVHCSKAVEDLQLTGAPAVLAAAAAACAPAALRSRLTVLSDNSSNSGKTSPIYLGELGSDSPLAAQLLSFLFHRGTGSDCCAIPSGEDREEPLVLLSRTPDGVTWEDWRDVSWLPELPRELFLLRCISVGPLLGSNPSHKSGDDKQALQTSEMISADRLLEQLTRLVNAAVTSQQAKALQLCPHLRPRLDVSSPPVAAVYRGEGSLRKNAKLFVVLDRPLTGLCLLLLLDDLLAKLPTSWTPGFKGMKLFQVLGLRIQIPQQVTDCFEEPLFKALQKSSTFGEGAMDVPGVKTLMQHHWKERKHLHVQLSEQWLEQQERQELTSHVVASRLLRQATESVALQEAAQPKDIIPTSKYKATLVFSSSWGASSFLRFHSKGIGFPQEVTLYRPPLPVEAKLSPFWPGVHWAVRKQAKEQREVLNAGEPARVAGLAELSVSIRGCICRATALNDATGLPCQNAMLWHPCAFAAMKATPKSPCPTAEGDEEASTRRFSAPEPHNLASLPLSKLPSWHLRRRGVNTQRDLIALLEELYHGALPLPISTLEGLYGALPGNSYGSLYANPCTEPQAVSLDLDLLSYCPDRLLEFITEVASLKLAWDRAVRHLMFRFGVRDEASLLSGQIDPEAVVSLGHMESWPLKMLLSISGLCCSFIPRRFFGLDLNYEQKRIVAVTAYYLSYVPQEKLEAFVALRKKPLKKSRFTAPPRSSEADTEGSPPLSSEEIRAFEALGILIADTQPLSPLMTKNNSTATHPEQRSPWQEKTPSSKEAEGSGRFSEEQSRVLHTGIRGPEDACSPRQHLLKHQSLQQQQLFSFPWMLYNNELKDIKAIALGSGALHVA
ncbi:uncharacterized protein LOC34622736 [Cyclospora cayetanensis]|uniref:Uncharacterized protein LOC34622736 n=1 Tax=Cyclospora cayetanensis TaxID=88456 RepID=A0A6P6RRK1_9EIME|nr:uncharacterized protein LOC34622736 [Cyclospora cayetanensis]